MIGRQISPAIQHAVSPEPKASSHGDLLPGSLATIEMLEPFLSTRASTELCLILVRVQVDKDSLPPAPALSGHFETSLIQCIQKQIRPSDILVRSVANRFVVIQFSGDRSQANSIANRIRQAAESQLVELHAQASVGIKVSIARMPDDGHSVDELILAAELRLDSRDAKPRGDLGPPPKSIH